jgi:hypothetical protein
LSGFVHAMGARLVLSDLAAADSVERHDPQRLSEAYRQALGSAARSEGDGAWR